MLSISRLLGVTQNLRGLAWTLSEDKCRSSTFELGMLFSFQRPTLSSAVWAAFRRPPRQRRQSLLIRRFPSREFFSNFLDSESADPPLHFHLPIPPSDPWVASGKGVMPEQPWCSKRKVSFSFLLKRRLFGVQIFEPGRCVRPSRSLRRRASCASDGGSTRGS